MRASLPLLCLVLFACDADKDAEPGETGDSGPDGGDLGVDDAAASWEPATGPINVRIVRGIGGDAVVAAGAPEASGGGVYLLSPGGTSTAALSGQASGERVGAALAAGDLDDDGQLDLVVGGPGLTSTYETSSGSIREVEEGGRVLALLGPVTGASTPDSADGSAGGEEASGYAGAALAIDDFDGDGRTEVAAGVPNHASSGASGGEGLVVMLPGPPSEWESLTDYGVRLGGAPAGFEAGTSLAAPGDLDGDGTADLAIGALGSTREGVVYVALGPITADASVQDSDATLSGRVAGGGALRIARLGDLDGDGRDDLGVGAPGEDPGAVYLLQSSWTPSGAAELADAASSSIAAPDAHGAFGVSLAAGDLDDDGVLDLAVGAELDPYAAGQAGAVYYYTRSAFTEPVVVIRGSTDAGGFGTSIAVDDADGDGVDDLVVGSWLGKAWMFSGTN